jgi:hypothetical protein
MTEPTIINANADSTTIVQNIQQGTLQDSTGNLCIKKISGISFLVTGAILGLILFWRGLIDPEHSYEASMSVMTTFLVSGGSLIGLSSIDGLKSMFSRGKQGAV